MLRFDWLCSHIATCFLFDDVPAAASAISPCTVFRIEHWLSCLHAACMLFEPALQWLMKTWLNLQFYCDNMIVMFGFGGKVSIRWCLFLIVIIKVRYLSIIFRKKCHELLSWSKVSLFMHLPSFPNMNKWFKEIFLNNFYYFHLEVLPIHRKRVYGKPDP